MKLIDLEMLRRANQSKGGHPRGVSSDVERKGPLLFWGPDVSRSLTLGVGGFQSSLHSGAGENCGTLGWDAQYGRAGAFKLRVTRSASMLRSINE